MKKWLCLIMAGLWLLSIPALAAEDEEDRKKSDQETEQVERAKDKTAAKRATKQMDNMIVTASRRLQPGLKVAPSRPIRNTPRSGEAMTEKTTASRQPRRTLAACQKRTARNRKKTIYPGCQGRLFLVAHSRNRQRSAGCGGHLRTCPGSRQMAQLLFFLHTSNE